MVCANSAEAFSCRPSVNTAATYARLRPQKHSNEETQRLELVRLTSFYGQLCAGR